MPSERGSRNYLGNLVLALRGADRHSRNLLSLTNPMKTSVLSLITVLTIAVFLGCQSQKKEEATATTSTSATTTHATSTTGKKTSGSKAKPSPTASLTPQPKKTTKKKESASPKGTPEQSPTPEATP